MDEDSVERGLTDGHILQGNDNGERSTEDKGNQGKSFFRFVTLVPNVGRDENGGKHQTTFTAAVGVVDHGEILFGRRCEVRARSSLQANLGCGRALELYRAWT